MRRVLFLILRLAIVAAALAGWLLVVLGFYFALCGLYGVH